MEKLRTAPLQGGSDLDILPLPAVAHHNRCRNPLDRAKNETSNGWRGGGGGQPHRTNDGGVVNAMSSVVNVLHFGQHHLNAIALQPQKTTRDNVKLQDSLCNVNLQL